ncbi:MAG TPA: hypothetical protein VMZ73_04355 [Acidimicrobiales bacterium]|nr:hypothetical protein [Acidimicrobiales bacterium]
MRRMAPVFALTFLLMAGCGSDGDAAAPATTTTAAPTTTMNPPTTIAASTTTSSRPPAATSTTRRPAAATAVIEPDKVAGIPLGATKGQAIAVLGQPTRTTQETDLSGKKYDALAWDLSGNRGLSLAFGTDSATSPLLTDWRATFPGPVTKAGVQVGDTAAKVTSAYGALQPFCCDTKIANVNQGAGRMIVIVGNASQKVDQIVGGDPAFWSRKIAD